MAMVRYLDIISFKKSHIQYAPECFLTQRLNSTNSYLVMSYKACDMLLKSLTRVERSGSIPILF